MQAIYDQWNPLFTLDLHAVICTFKSCDLIDQVFIHAVSSCSTPWVAAHVVTLLNCLSKSFSNMCCTMHTWVMWPNVYLQVLRQSCMHSRANYHSNINNVYTCTVDSFYIWNCSGSYVATAKQNCTFALEFECDMSNMGKRAFQSLHHPCSIATVKAKVCECVVYSNPHCTCVL